MKKPNYSLKRRLLVSISVPVLIAGLLIALLSFLFSWHEITEVYDAQMAHSARILIDLTEEGTQGNSNHIHKTKDNHTDIQHRYERKTGYRLWRNDELVLESLRAKDFGAFRAPEGFSDQTLHGKPWRFFVYQDPTENITVEISQRYAIRYELINQLMLSLLIPAFLFVPIILGLIWVATKKSLKPLDRILSDVDKRHSDDLTSVETANAPQEILPLVHAMNRLFLRIHASFAREREFTDHAAHELRTPLAAMKTQAQVLLKKSSANPDLHDGFENLNMTIERSTRLIEQLLSLARLQNEQLQLVPTDLSDCLHEAIDVIEPQARDKGHVLNVDIPEQFYIRGQHDSLVIMLRNLMDNAVKYTPAGGQIDILLDTQGELIIRDTGPGMNAEQKGRAFDRFARFDKSGQTGSGLGLSIADWIAKSHTIHIQLADHDPHGLSIHIDWKNLTISS